MSSDNVVQLRVPQVVNAQLIGEIADDLRQFLRSSWIGSDIPSDPEYLNGGRELIEDFALRAAAHADDRDAARRGQDLDLREIAQALYYLAQLEVRDGAQC